MSTTESLLNVPYQIQRPSQQPIPLEINHPTLSPEPSVQSSTPARSPFRDSPFATAIERHQPIIQTWASPAFLKRNYSVARDYDPFVDEEFPDNERKKRTKFGRSSGEWRFAERTPSPDQEPKQSRLEDISTLGLTAQDERRGEEDQLYVQLGHNQGSPSKHSSVATSASPAPSELNVQSGVDSIVETTFVVDERKEPSISLSRDKHVLHKVTEDENIENITATNSSNSNKEPNSDPVEVVNQRGAFDSSSKRPISPISQKDNGDEEDFQKTVEVAQALPSVPIERRSPASSSTPESHRESARESDQQSDDATHHEIESVFDEQSESGKSSKAVYSGPPSDFGIDGSTFSRPPPLVELVSPPSVIGRLEESIEVDELKTGVAQNILSPLQKDSEQSDSEPETPSTSKDPAAEFLLSGDEGSGVDIDMTEEHDAAQRRSSVQMPSPDRLGSPEAEELDDDAIKTIIARQLLVHDQSSSKCVDILRDETPIEQSSSSPPSSSDRLQSQESQEIFMRRSHEFAEDEAALEPILEENTTVNMEEEFLSPSPRRGEILDASNAEDALKTSPEKDRADPVVPQEVSITLELETVSDTRLSPPNDSKILPTQGLDPEVSDRARDMGMLPTNIQKSTVEIIDLESGDEGDISPHNFRQEDLQLLVDKNDSEFAQTNESLARKIPLPISDPRNGHQTSTSEKYRPTDFPEPTVLASKPTAATIEGYEEEVPSAEEAPFQRSGQEGLPHEEHEPSFKSEHRLEQSLTAETELEPTAIDESLDELPSTVPDSIEEKPHNSQLLTPSSTQPTNIVSPPSVNLKSTPEDKALPTPRLTQGTSAEIVPPQRLAPPEESIFAENPAPPKKTSALIERLKEMRRLSIQSPKPRSSESRVLDPWFAPKRPSQVVPDSEDESGAENSPEREVQTDTPKLVATQLPYTPEKPLAKIFIRSPSQPAYISSIQSSPQYLPPSQPPPPGFRTNLSYFVPLATLPSHFATAVDILAIALSSTPVTRAVSGPRDYNQTLYFTDPSSLGLQHPITIAQIFRPSNRCFPLTEKGDALLLRDFKVQPFQRRLSLLSTSTSAWAVFRKGADVQMRGPQVEFGAEERGFARGLWDWWTSVGENARKRLEDAVPEYKKHNATATNINAKASGNKGDAPIKKEGIEGLGVDLPGSQSKRRESIEGRSLDLDGVQERDMVHESIEAPKLVLRARGARGTNGRSESARESRYGTVFTGGLGEPGETQGSAHELRDGKAYQDKR